MSRGPNHTVNCIACLAVESAKVFCKLHTYPMLSQWPIFHTAPRESPGFCTLIWCITIDYHEDPSVLLCQSISLSPKQILSLSVVTGIIRRKSLLLADFEQGREKQGMYIVPSIFGLLSQLQRGGLYQTLGLRPQ